MSSAPCGSPTVREITKATIAPAGSAAAAAQARRSSFRTSAAAVAVEPAMRAT
jgi:hypothetical protein